MLKAAPPVRGRRCVPGDRAPVATASGEATTTSRDDQGSDFRPGDDIELGGERYQPVGGAGTGPAGENSAWITGPTPTTALRHLDRGSAAAGQAKTSPPLASRA